MNKMSGEFDRLLATLEVCDDILERNYSEELLDADFIRVIERERDRIESKIYGSENRYFLEAF